MKLFLALNSFALVAGRDGFRKTRGMQETVPEGGLCNTMIPPSPLAPDDSSCWQWYTPPSDGILPPGADAPPTGCDYAPCEAAVCECDSYCCDSAWDLSCRGYYMKAGDDVENNYFVPGCSAKLLCCEQESAFPDPPIGAAMAGAMVNAVQVFPAFAEEVTEFSCEAGTVGCCDTMKPPSFLPPDDSTCWQWWDVPVGGNVPDGEVLPKGCDYKPCEAAVCACDSYCCDTVWDLSCRGYETSPGDSNNNYFVDKCSAMILCCEPESAFPKPPVGGAILEEVVEKIIKVPVEKIVEVPVPVPAAKPIVKEILVPVPVPKPVVKEIPVPVPAVAAQTVVKEVPLPIPVIKQIPVPVAAPVSVKLPVITTVTVPAPAPCVCPPLTAQTSASKTSSKSGSKSGISSTSSKSGKSGSKSGSTLSSVPGTKGSKSSKGSSSSKCGTSVTSTSGKSGKAGSKSSGVSSKHGKAGSKSFAAYAKGSKSSSKGSSTVTVSTTTSAVATTAKIRYYTTPEGCTCPMVMEDDCVESTTVTTSSKGKAGKSGNKGTRRLRQ